MTEQETATRVEALKNLIVDRTQSHFDAEGTGLLMSQLGQFLARQHPELRDALHGRKLAGFIEAELADKVKLLDSPESRIVKIVLPVSVNTEGDLLRLFPRRDETVLASSTPRYSRAFWAAFSQPLVAGRTRVMRFDPHVHYQDIEGEPVPAEGVTVVPSDSIVGEAVGDDPAMRTKKISASIERWLQANAVDIGKVTAKASTLAGSMSSRDSGTSLLDLLLSALGEGDLKRIQMPLDVIAKLNRLPR